MFSTQTSDGWFRLGRVQVTSTVALAGMGVIGVIIGAIAPALLMITQFHPALFLGGGLWTPLTWPWLDTISLWTVFSLVILWFFGSDLEQLLGRVRMAWLYFWCWAALTVVTFAVGMVLPTGALLGLGQIQFLVMLLWIADNPRRPFFFGIPAWVIGAVLVAVQMLGMVAARALGGLVSLLLVFAVIAMVSRRLGLLTDFTWIPGRPGQRRASTLKPARAPRAQARQQARRTTDSARIDELLDKINAEGIHSLSKAERNELDKLRERRRR